MSVLGNYREKVELYPSIMVDLKKPVLKLTRLVT